jgi:hypothetical protein
MLTNASAAMSMLANSQKMLESLREQAKTSKDTNLKETISSFYDSFLDLKAMLLRLVDENATLTAKLRDEGQADPCPKCRKRGWHLEKSSPDTLFGQLGGIRRLYKCSECGFSESILYHPSDKSSKTLG